MKVRIISIFLAIFLLSNSAFANNNPMPIDSRIKTLVYSPNEIFQVKFMVGYQSIIELENGEEIELISFGDPIPWSLKVLGRRLFLKAMDPGVKTNMTIITTKRTYLLEISSSESQDDLDDRIAYILRFFYPNINVDMPPAMKNPPKKEIKLSDRVTNINQKVQKIQMTDVISINSHYAYGKKSSDKFLPIRVFDNGISTFFKFKQNIKNIPSINAISENGEEIPLKIRISGENMIVNVVEKQFIIRDPEDRESFAQIINEDSNKTYGQK